MNKNERCYSIIMTVYDQARELQENLHIYLSQEYEPGYEVIVVDETSTDDTSDVLKLLKNEYPHLYTTFLPKPNRLVVRRKMAISIGIKAAKKDWVIITKISKKPHASDILQAIAENTDGNDGLILGYINKKGIRLQPFTDYTDAKDHIRKAERRLRKVYERKRLSYTLGRYDFIIIRKDQAYEMLKFFEEKISGISLIGIRFRIICKNIFGRSSTTLLRIE